MRGQCGKTSFFSPDLPCALEEVEALEPDAALRKSIVSVCGEDFARGALCCTQEQVDSLKANLEQAEPLISGCPACRNNFRQLFCSMSCDPNQSTFLNVVKSQKTSGGPDGDIAVKQISYYVGEEWRQTFFDNCKDVKFGPGNSFAIELLGGGAKTADEMLKFLGDEKPVLGSPFQIDFPHLSSFSRANQTSAPPIPMNNRVRKCSDPDLLSRCACTDCPAVCATLPILSPPRHESRCNIPLPGGTRISCFALGIVLLYSIAIAAFVTGIGLGKRSRKKRAALYHRNSGISVRSESSGYERVRLESEETATMPPSSANRLVGASADEAEDDSTSSMGTARGRGVLAGLGLGTRGSGGNDLSALSSSQPKTYPLAIWLNRFFYKLGYISASYPYLTFAAALLLVGIANLGWRSFEVETDPIRLWVSPGSEARHRKDYFDEHFGPFYRTQQVFVMDQSASLSSLKGIDHDSKEWQQILVDVGPVLSWERLQWWSDVEAAVRTLKSPRGTSLQDVCFAPSGKGGPCVVQSIMGYFGEGLEGAGVNANNWQQSLDNCAATPVDCLPPFGQPLKRNIVMGGVPNKAPASQARSLVTTWVIANSLNNSDVLRAQEWEVALEKLLFSIAGIGDLPEHPLGRRRRELGLQLSLSTESSLEQELAKSGSADVIIVVLSYTLMFLYASLSLGKASRFVQKQKKNHARPHGRTHRTGLAGQIMSFMPMRNSNNSGAQDSFTGQLIINSKFSLGLFGIIVVLASVSSAVGLFSALGVKVTLVIAEVLPFLLLAVGVDNIFLLAAEMDRQNTAALVTDLSSSRSRQADRLEGDDEEASLEEDHTYGAGMARESSSSIVALPISAEERAARTLSRVGPSILLSASVQVCAFLLGATIPMPAVRHFALYAAVSMAFVAVLQCTVFISAMALDAKRMESNRIDCLPCIKLASTSTASDRQIIARTEGLLTRFFRYKYAPTIIKTNVKRAVMILFGTTFALSCISTRHLHMGLDQRLALPSGSYLRSYFDAIDVFLDVGPPVYFVEKDIDVTTRAGQQAICGRFTTCQPLSLANTLEGERGRTDVSFLAEPTSSWLDDFFQWMNPVLESCCRVKQKDPSIFCSPNDSEFDCQPCFTTRKKAWNITLDGMPEGDEFMMYLRQWLKSPTDSDCPLGGQAAYSASLQIDEANNKVVTTNFRTFHSPLRSQADFIDALTATSRISQDIVTRNRPSSTTTKDLDVFAYSVYAPFFDQYLYLDRLALQLLGGSLLAILIVTTLLLGSIRTAIIVGICISNAVFCVAAIMAILGIGVNALTLVNLAVCSAICVEFCAHVARAFMRAPGSLSRHHPMAQKERDDRVYAALVDVGPAVVSGITGTKLVGISVLFWAQSEM